MRSIIQTSVMSFLATFLVVGVAQAAPTVQVTTHPVYNYGLAIQGGTVDVLGMAVTGNSITFLGGGSINGNQPTLNLNQGGSELYDNGNLHLATDDNLYLDTQDIWSAGVLHVLGAGISGNVIDLAGGANSTPTFNFNKGDSRLFDDGTLRIATDDDLVIQAPHLTELTGGLSVDKDVSVAGALTVTGSFAANVAGNASTATALQTPRTINGVSFDGTSNITIASSAAADALTGSTLASGVTASSLTSVGELSNLTVTHTSTADDAALLVNHTANGSSNSAGIAVLPAFTSTASGGLYSGYYLGDGHPTNTTGADNYIGMQFADLTDPGSTIASSDIYFGSGYDHTITMKDGGTFDIIDTLGHSLFSVADGGTAGVVTATGSLTSSGSLLLGGSIKNATTSHSLISFSDVTNAVNNLKISNAATGGTPAITAAGSDSNTGMQFVAKGTGSFTFGNFTPTDDALIINVHDSGATGFFGTLSLTPLTGARTWSLPDASGNLVLDTATQTLTNKTLTAPTIGGDMTFLTASDHVLSVGNNTISSGIAANNLTVAAGSKTLGTGNGGNLNLNAGSSFGGTAGTITIGTVGSAVTITPPLTISSGLSLEKGTGVVSSNSVTVNKTSGVITDDATDIAPTSTRAGISWFDTRITTSSVIQTSICDTPDAGAMLTVATHIVADGNATITISNAGGTAQSTDGGTKVCFQVTN